MPPRKRSAGTIGTQLGIAVAALLLASCGPQRAQFQPLEKAEGYSVEGYRQAIYDLTNGKGRFGEAKVSSSGAYRATVGGVEQTVIQLGFEIENAGDEPIEIDLGQLRLESVQTKQQVIRNLPVSSSAGDRVIPPATTGTLEVYFTLPPTIRPTDVYAFRAAWAARSDGQRYAEFTPFAQYEEYAYVPVYAYYHPYYSWGYPYYTPYYVPYVHRVTIVRQRPTRVVVRPEHPRPTRRQ